MYPDSTHNSCFVFLAGVHGVGKTTLCRTVFEPSGFHCVTASNIIKGYGGEVSLDKSVGDIGGNQRKLIGGIAALRTVHRQFLVDGHYALLNKQGEVERIPTTVFRAMAPDCSIVLTDAPEKIAERLMARDQKTWPVELVAQIQQAEVEHAEAVSKEAGIPFRMFTLQEASTRVPQFITEIIR